MATSDPRNVGTLRLLQMTLTPEGVFRVIGPGEGGRKLVITDEQALVIGDDWSQVLVFVPGFLARPHHYRTFLSETAGGSITVVCPLFPKSTLGALSGRPTPMEDATAAADLVDRIRSSHSPESVWIGGHSRGGQVAWLTANALAIESTGCDGVVAVDPVDGSGPRAPQPNATAKPSEFEAPTLIIGAGVGTRCAPTGLNHAAFAACSPGVTEYVVYPDMGHADLLTGITGVIGRTLCKSGRNPVDQRKATALHISRFLTSHS